MEYNETNSSSLDTTLVGLGIAHLVIVCIPSVILGTAALIFICQLIKMKQIFMINSTILLYSVMIVLSISGPFTYGLFSDISLIIGAPQICKYYPSGLAGNLSFKIFHTLLSNVIGLASVLQFMILKYGKRITLKATIIALILVATISVTIPCAVIFNEYDYLEIRGIQCTSDPDTTQLHLAILLLFGYIPSLVITIAATLITHYKLKKSIFDQKKSAIVRSVLAINLFNIVQFNLFRAASVILFYVGISVAPEDDLTIFKLLVVVGRYIADLSYPVTTCSIIMMHKSLRSMLLSCLKTVFCIDTPQKLHLELSKSTVVSMIDQQVMKD